jgi:hypothetical protein
MGGIEPPYTIRIINLAGTAQEVRDYISIHIQAIREARSGLNYMGSMWK